MTNKRMHADILYDNEVLELPVRSLDLVSEVKKRIGVKTRLAPGQINLKYNGKTLHDDLKLDHCGVCEDSPQFKLTVNDCGEVAVEQTSYQSPYKAAGESKNLLVQQSPQEASLGGKGIHSHDKVEATTIDLRTHYPTPGRWGSREYWRHSSGDTVPERLTNSISLGLRLHSAHMLSLALTEYQDANQALLSHCEEYEALIRVSMAEDRLKEEMHRMGATLQDGTVNNQGISAAKKH